MVMAIIYGRPDSELEILSEAPGHIEGKTKERIGFFKKYWYVWFGAFITIMIAIFSKNS